MGKRLASILKVLAGLLLLAGLSLYLFRQPVLDAVLENQLTRFGVPAHSLSIEDVSLNGLLLHNLSLGNSDELLVDKINARWSLPGLLQGELQTIEISGLQLLLDLSGEGPPLGSLQKLIDGEGDSSKSKTPLVTLQDAQLNLLTPYGNMEMNFDGSIEQGPSDTILIKMVFDTAAEHGHTEGNLDATLGKDGNLQGTLMFTEGKLNHPHLNIAGFNARSSFNLIDKQLQEMTADLALSDISISISEQKQSVFEQATVTAQLDPLSAGIKAEIFTPDNIPTLSFDATSRDHQQHANIKVNLNADVGAELPVWGFLGLPQPNTGSVSLSLHSDGEIPAECIKNFNWMSCLQQSRLKSTGKVTVDELGYTQQVSNLNGHVAFDAKLEDGYSNIDFMEDSKLDASGLDIEWLTSIGIPVEQTSLLNQDTQLRLNANGKNNVSIHLGSRAEDIQLGLETSLALSADATQASISGQARARLNHQYQLASFNISDLNAMTSGINYGGSTLDKLILTGSIQGSPESFNGKLDLSAKTKQLRFDLLDARQVKATLPLQLIFKDRIWGLTLRKQGQISFGKLAPNETFRIQGPLIFRLPKASLEIAPNTNSQAFRHQITILSNDFNLLVDRIDAPAIEAQIRPGKIILTGKLEGENSYSGKGIIRATNITLPQQQIKLNNIASTIYLAPPSEGIHADVNIAKIRQLAPTAYFSPLNIAGNVKLKHKLLSVKASGGIVSKQLFNLTARHSLASEKGNLKLVINPLVFSSDGMQPSAVFPSLAILEDVHGEINTSSSFNWSKDNISSDAMIDIHNLSFVQNNTTLNGLSASLRMTDLLSPQSEPEQKITIQQINPGVPIKDVEISYQVQAAASPQIAIDQSQLAMLGGTLSTGPVIIDPLAKHNDVVILVEGINLTDLFELIEVDGLAGEGRLHGSIPISFDDGLVSIQDSILTADKPGILRFKSDTVSNILSGKAEEVDLLLEALTEFHYSELTLKLNNSTSNDLVATLSLLGHNPHVQQGRLFRLNLNLESNVSKILDAIAQAYGLSNTAIQRAFRLR